MRNHITESEAVQELGFKSLWVWRNELNTNVQAVEEALQKACEHLQLGVRLHRVSGAGAKGIQHPSFEGSGVYITFSDEVEKKIAAGEVVVNHRAILLSSCNRLAAGELIVSRPLAFSASCLCFFFMLK